MVHCGSGAAGLVLVWTLSAGTEASISGSAAALAAYGARQVRRGSRPHNPRRDRVDETATPQLTRRFTEENLRINVPTFWVGDMFLEQTPGVVFECAIQSFVRCSWVAVPLTQQSPPVCGTEWKTYTCSLFLIDKWFTFLTLAIAACSTLFGAARMALQCFRFERRQLCRRKAWIS